ncbi:MAG TPA: copper resistance protein CopC [Actinomycetota bacterium]|nr:copper resistance protein CopC [Actinomycetota bacterium]
MRYLLRTALATAALLALLSLAAVPAWAHASLRTSSPSGGAAVEEAPRQVTITFTESPDPKLSVVRVLGASGSFEQGQPRHAEGDDLTLVVDLKELPKGSYTVSWRTVSRVDGHSSAGAFAFGVGEPPDPAAAEAEATETTSKIPQATARWVFYSGLASIVGAAWMALFAFRSAPRLVRRLAEFGWLLAFAALLALSVLQYREAGVGFGVFAGSSSGRALALRAAPVLVTGLALLASRKRFRGPMGLALLGALGAMLAHSAAGHAAVPPDVVPKVAVQWLHFAAVGVWIGGLAALLLGLSGLSPEERGTVTRRFSLVAGIAIFLVTGTGVLRAVNEVGGWEPLFDTPYGRLVIAKSALLVVLGGFGALNRFRNVPAAVKSPAGLQKAGRLEVAIAVVTLALAGMLSTSVPPISIAQAAEEARVTSEGTDFGRIAEAVLTVEPGTAGPNRFLVELTDPDTGDPLEGVERATLRLASLSNPAAGESTLELQRQEDGRYQATGSNVAIDGRWRATLSVTTSGNSFDVPLEFSTRAVGYTSDRSEVEGQPTIYSVTDPQGRQLQVYSQPDDPGPSELHLTLFDSSGTEMPVGEIVAIAVPPNESSVTLVTRRFGPGHFVSDVELKRGTYTFDITARNEAGETVRFPAELEVS